MTLFTADVAVRGSFLATKDCHKTRQLEAYAAISDASSGLRST